MAQYGPPTTRGVLLDQFAYRLFQVQRENRAKFDEVLGEVVDPVPNWTIDQADSERHYLKLQRDGLSHNSEGLGEGLVSLLFIIDALYDSEPEGVIVIDEPELSLHPSLQRRLFTLLNKYAADRQIVISTHSPYFVGFEALFNGARIARLHLRDGSTISALSEPTVKRLEGFTKNYNNPHVLGLNAREVFFLEDGVILVEGQEDVVFYQKIAERLDQNIEGNFFGWGVGGADNMQIIASMLNELGFKRVVGILDKNKEGLVQDLQKRFPDYRFESIPANDVRTKPKTKARECVQGILDGNGEVRAEYVEYMKALFARLNQAL